jgi:hypothetical protein
MPAHRLGEDVDLHRLLAAVGLRHAGDADERIVLDVGERRLDDSAHRGIVTRADRRRRSPFDISKLAPIQSRPAGSKPSVSRVGPVP